MVTTGNNQKYCRTCRPKVLREYNRKYYLDRIVKKVAPSEEGAGDSVNLG